MRFLHLISLLPGNVLWELFQRALEDLVDLSDFPFSTLLVACLLVVTLHHVNKLFRVITGHNDIAKLLLWLHLSFHCECARQLSADYKTIDGLFRILLDYFSQLLCELK